MKQIILFGAGGHAAVIVDMLKAQIEVGAKLRILGYLDDSNKKEWMGYPVLGRIEDALLFQDIDTVFVIAIGNNMIREKIKNQFRNLKYYSIIHPSAIIGSNVEIGDGTVVMPGTVINANVRIGNHTIINSGAIIEHDSLLGDYVHISPRATLCGTVTVCNLTHIGAGATIIPGIIIGEKSIVGAGTTVIQDIESNITVVGCPARRIN